MEISIYQRVVKFSFQRSRGFYSTTEIPGAPHTCKESREVYQKYYQPSIGVFLDQSELGINYINFEVDIMYLSNKIADRIPIFFVCLEPGKRNRFDIWLLMRQVWRITRYKGQLPLIISCANMSKCSRTSRLYISSRISKISCPKPSLTNQYNESAPRRSLSRPTSGERHLISYGSAGTSTYCV